MSKRQTELLGGKCYSSGKRTSSRGIQRRTIGCAEPGSFVCSKARIPPTIVMNTSCPRDGVPRRGVGAVIVGGREKRTIQMLYRCPTSPE